MSMRSLEELYIATFWVLWYNIKVSDAESFQEPHSRIAAFGGIGALLCAKLFISSFVGGWI